MNTQRLLSKNMLIIRKSLRFLLLGTPNKNCLSWPVCSNEFDILSLWSTIVNLFWALFGLIESDVFEESGSSETAVATLILAIWLVLAVVILLNMLIALITDSFEGIKV